MTRPAAAEARAGWVYRSAATPGATGTSAAGEPRTGGMLTAALVATIAVPVAVMLTILLTPFGLLVGSRRP